MKTLIALLALAFSLNSFAADKKKVSQKKKSLSEVLKENNITTADIRKELRNIMNESEANREGKQFSLLVGIGGRHAMMTKSLAADYYYSQNNALGLSYSTGKNSYAYYGDGISLRNMEADVIEIYSKNFLGNSFFAKTSVGYRLMKGESKGLYDVTTGRYINEGLEEKKYDGTILVLSTCHFLGLVALTPCF